MENIILLSVLIFPAFQLINWICVYLACNSNVQMFVPSRYLSIKNRWIFSAIMMSGKQALLLIWKNVYPFQCQTNILSFKLFNMIMKINNFEIDTSYKRILIKKLLPITYKLQPNSKRYRSELFRKFKPIVFLNYLSNSQILVFLTLNDLLLDL